MSGSDNIFDHLEANTPIKAANIHNELECYLLADLESTDNIIKWWIDRRALCPRLSCMALDYHTIPGTSSLPTILFISPSPTATLVAVERLFSNTIVWVYN
ncbi:hypothetical protein K523DRAFT_409029 [Schizophyllum commune Tattone D]|nr:hypothetical protein K523DRAFT_409029 [Schizophyllum commune Tattone D]